MTSFMGPMAPPPAAPAQPQALDIRTDPNQRQQFKQFMKQRTSMAPMTSAPIAQPPMPMMQPPMPMPMGQDIDIFAPQRFEDGGIVSSLNSLQQQAAQFAEQLQSTVMGGGSGGGMGGSMGSGGFGGSFNSGDMSGGTIEPQPFDLPGGPTYGFESGGAVPPRRTDIRGQDHMLSYITPDEADILMALGGSGEAGPMGIPAFRSGPGDMGAGSGDVGTEGEGMGEGQGGDGMGGGAPGGGGSSDNDDSGYGFGQHDDASSPGQTSSDTSSDTSGSDADEVSDALADIAAAEIAGQMADDRAAARDRAIRDAFVTDSRGVPIGTPGSPSGRFGGNLGKTGVDQDTVDRALDALAGVPGSRENLAAAAAAAQEASFGAPAGIASVSGVPADPLSSSKKGLLGLNPQDLLAIENFSYAPPAQTNVSLSRNPSSFTGKVSAPIGLQDIQAIDELSFGPPAPGSGLTQSQIDNFTEQGLVTDAAPVASAPSSNVVSDFSPTPADQLADVYGIDLDALNAAVDDPNAAIGARGPTATDASAGIGYDPVTDMPYGLEFATNPAVPGAQFTTNLAGLTEQQQKDQPFSMDVAQFIGSKPYGYEIDPKTGRAIGQIGTPPMGILGSLTNLAQNLFMGPPQTTQDLIERGAYTGMTGQGDGGEGGDGPDQPVKAPTDPCPDGFVMKNGACTPIDTGSGVPNQIGGMNPKYNAPPVIVPSPRFPGYSLQGPVGYGSPIAGQAAPSVASNAAMYQQMLQGGRPPLRLEDGGAVPPRNIEISGQDHMLSYITPDEADILKSLGGSGKPGPMGIPSFEGDGDATPYQRGKSFYRVPVGTFGGGPDDMQFKKVYIGSNQDTMENRQLGSSSLASATQDMPGPIPQAVNRDEYLRQYERDLAALQGRPDPYPDPVPDPVVPDPVVEDPAPPDPNAYNPIMDVVVPSTRLQDFPASAPPASTQPMPFQGPVGYGSPIAGQGPGSINPLLSGGINPLYSNALNFQNMLGQPFPLKLQQGGAVSSNLDMAADNFLKALMPAA
jgi:hypothetical protein